MQIRDSVALVTGANRGIGRALVDALLAADARRVYAAARDVRTLASLAAANPTRVVPLAVDVTDARQVEAAAECAPDVTLLVNNAGALAMGGVLDAPLELVARDVDTNYYGVLRMARAFAPALVANAAGTPDGRGAAVVNLLTVVALASMPGLSAYNASKAAAWSITQSLRAALGPRGVEVFGVFPGAVDTDMIRDFDMPKTGAAEVARAVLAGVEAGTEDIFPDPMSRQLYAAWAQDHKAVERQFAAM